MKMIMFFRRRPDLTAAQFRDHYENRHVPLATSLFPYFKDYRRNYVRHDLQHRRADAEGSDGGFGFDVITELTFAEPGDYERMVRQMADPATREQVIEDELKFMDRSATIVLMVDEETTLFPCPAAVSGDAACE